MNLFQMSREERVAFFINIYNALVVHAMAMFGPAENTLKRYAKRKSAAVSPTTHSQCWSIIPSGV